MRASVMIATLLVLLITTGACQTRTGRTTAGQTIDDAKITATVKSKLIAEKPSNLTRVSVKTDKGVVYLDGAVNTPEQKARAQQIARDTSGVRVVVDNLQVQPK